MPSPCYAGPPAGAGLFAFVKGSRGCGGGAPDALPLDLSHLWPRRRDSAVGCPGGWVGGGRGAGRGCDEGSERVAWHSKSKELPLAQIGARAACGLSRTTSAGIFSAHRRPGRSPRAPDPARRKYLLQLSRCPAPAAGRGVRRRQGATGLRFLCGHLSRRCHLLTRAARTPSLPLAQPKFPALGRLVASGATKRGPRVRADFGVGFQD